MSEIKISDLIMRAVEVVLSRDGDVNLEDGSFATCGTDEIIHLEAAIVSTLDLPSDDVNIHDMHLICHKANEYDKLTEENKMLRDFILSLQLSAGDDVKREDVLDKTK